MCKSVQILQSRMGKSVNDTFICSDTIPDIIEQTGKILQWYLIFYVERQQKFLHGMIFTESRHVKVLYLDSLTLPWRVSVTVKKQDELAYIKGV